MKTRTCSKPMVLLCGWSLLVNACGGSSPSAPLAQEAEADASEASADGGFGGSDTGAEAPGQEGADAQQEATGPGVAWQIPLDGDTVSGTLTESTCTVLVSAQEKIERVEFTLDGAPLNTEKSAPYGCKWDTTAAAAGAHVLRAVAFDASGGTGAASITVHVEAGPPAPGTTWYVNSVTGSDANDGLSAGSAWQTMAKVNGKTFGPGDVVRFQGTITDQMMGDPGDGTSSWPIVLVGDGPFEGRARIRGIRLKSARHVTIRNFEASGEGVDLVTTQASDTEEVRFVRFENLYLHDAHTGVVVSGPKHRDLTFVDTVIRGMWMDGVLLGDKAGDRFSFVGGEIKDTGNRGPQEHWAVHGVYASGGHGHVFDGVEYGDNDNGCSLSLRRGDVTVRNCVFHGGKMLCNNNEDEGSVNPYTGTASKSLEYRVYRNLFVGPGTVHQGGNNDQGIDDPGNTWAVFNNTFVDTTVNFGSTAGTAQYYDIYLRNNVFVGGAVQMKAPVSGHVHVLSNNGWWKAGTPQGSGNVSTDPGIDASGRVTSAGYRDVGTKAVAPGIALVPSGGDPLGYVGVGPDIGREEH